MYVEIIFSILLTIPTTVSDEIQLTEGGYSYSPSISRSQNGTVWLAWKNFNPETRKTSINTASYKDGSILEKIEVTRTSGDILFPEIISTGDDSIRVFWSEFRNEKWNIYSKEIINSQITEETQITKDGKSFNHAAAVDKKGDLYVVYQSKKDGNFKIYMKRYSSGEWQQEECISENKSSNRSPAIAVDSKNRVWVAWDTFRNGNYDIYMRFFHETWSDPIRLTYNMRYDMTPSLAVDSEDGIWIAWVRSPLWGKERYRLNVGKRLMIRKYEPDTGKFLQPEVMRRDLDSMVLIPVDPQERVISLTPKVIIGKDDMIHVLYRQFRDKGSNDWGWNVELISYSGNEWSEPKIISTEPGYPISKIDSIRDNSGNLWLIYQACDNPGGRKPLIDSDSNIYLHQLSFDTFEKPKLAASILPHNKHIEEFNIPRPDPDKHKHIKLEGQEYKLLWGDLHRHSTLSKCIPERDGTLWDHYRWAQDVAELDFYSITDHTEQTSDYEAVKGRIWCDLFNSESDFAGIFGYEQNFRDTEHTNFFYIDRSAGQTVREIRLANAKLTDAIKMMDEKGLKDKVLIVRHFHGDGFGKKYETSPPINPDYEWVIEAVQTRGFSPVTVAHYLSIGAKVGLIGSSDHSRYPGGHGGPWVYPYAITGLWAKDITRESIFKALKNRRCYATNGKKMSVEFYADNHFMGDEYETAKVPVLKVKAQGTTNIARIDIIRNGKVIVSRENMSNFEYRDDEIKKGLNYYYISVVQEREGDDNYTGKAVSSPIWIMYHQ
ncbi:DUF3604 domain-containing protein [Candidatus Poribacteria bacterium]|nr:DUF3604 domain-containing protein [Candidatus Poribacteria bacterium]